MTRFVIFAGIWLMLSAALFNATADALNGAQEGIKNFSVWLVETGRI